MEEISQFHDLMNKKCLNVILFGDFEGKGIYNNSIFEILRKGLYLTNKKYSFREA